MIYFLIAIMATTVGALTGMGGGIIIKPVLDVLGHYDATTIGVLSSITVFSMSLVSIGRQVAAKTKIQYSLAIPLSAGAVVGGLLGKSGLAMIVEAVGGGSMVTLVQNSILSVLILIVYVYMLKKDSIKTLGMTGYVPAILVGMMLGIFSSFLGIGGGPINVAILIYVFSLNTKNAAVCSIFTILFSQISSLASIALGTGFAIFDLTMLPYMVVGGVAGGFIGASLNKKLSEKQVEFWFNVIQLVVLAIAIYNIISNI